MPRLRAIQMIKEAPSMAMVLAAGYKGFPRARIAFRYWQAWLSVCPQAVLRIQGEFSTSGDEANQFCMRLLGP